MLLWLLLTFTSAQMGFDQEKTVHHFRLHQDGGTIDVSVKKDTQNTKEQIRAHLSHIATMFGGGDFEAPMLVHHTKDVPGITVLAERRDRITYRYTDTAAGGRVDVVTKDPAALTALHDFLRYQIREHKTGDAVTIVPRR